MAVAARPPHAGQLLREWRTRRNLSQFQLASGAAVSARHLSFIETGRARPSREMVLHLAERLEIPLRERNRLLLAEVLAYPNVRSEPPPVDAAAAAEIVLPLHLAHEGGRLSFFSTLTTFGTAADVTLAELAVEAFYPADAETAAALANPS